MRDAFVNGLLNLAKEDPRIELITGDLGFGVLKPFWEQVPDQFIDAGIAEQNMTSVAAGMASEGKIVFTYSIANFPTLRCLEQIRNDCAYPGLDVKILCVGGGLAYGSLGPSHQATEDIACLRSLPGVAVVCPGDIVEAESLVRDVAYRPGVVYVRLGRAGGTRIHASGLNLRIGEAVRVGDSLSRGDVALFSTGDILDEACESVRLLRQAGYAVEQYSFPTVKPIDEGVVLSCANRFRLIATVEEHNVIGGFGSAVAEVLATRGACARLLRVGILDEYCSEVGNRDYLRSRYGLKADAIALKLQSELRALDNAQ